MHYKDLDTPALLIDLERMQNNLLHMADVARKNGVTLRPHTKTHKCPEIAGMQLAHGAHGITVAKVGEAEVMVQAGFHDVLIANEVIGPAKYARLIELASGGARLCVAVDSETGAGSLNAALRDAGIVLDVLIEINCGQNRAGVLPGEQALNLARSLKPLSSIRLKGLMTHGGHSYNQTSREAIENIGLREGRVMVETAELLRRNGFDISVVSVGSTPTAPYCSSVPGITEIRPGTYVFHDLTQTNLGVCELDSCALSVLATVTSRPDPNRAVLDAGKKVLTSDLAVRDGGASGFGLIREKKTSITSLSEEHGVVNSEKDFEIGEKVRIIPNHACVVVNMFERMYGIRNDIVESTFMIAGRGKVM